MLSNELKSHRFPSRCMRKLNECFPTVSNRGPFACETNVITTTLQKLLIANYSKSACLQCPTVLYFCRFQWFDWEPMSLVSGRQPLLSIWLLNLPGTSKFKSVRLTNIRGSNDFCSFIHADETLSKLIVQLYSVVVSIFNINALFNTSVFIMNRISLKLNIT